MRYDNWNTKPTITNFFKKKLKLKLYINLRLKKKEPNIKYDLFLWYNL